MSGISFLLHKSKCSQQKVVSVESPSPKEDICGRLALMRYRNGMEDFAVLGCYFPPKPTSNGQKKYWTVCHSMLEWIEKHISQLPARCTILTFGDVNDDFGMPRQGSTALSSLAIGEARIGRERFVGAKVRVLCERHHLGLASTFFTQDPHIKDMAMRAM